MIDTKVATSTEVYSKAATLARMALLLRMMLISCLKEKKETVTLYNVGKNAQNI